MRVYKFVHLFTSMTLTCLTTSSCCRCTGWDRSWGAWLQESATELSSGPGSPTRKLAPTTSKSFLQLSSSARFKVTINSDVFVSSSTMASLARAHSHTISHPRSCFVLQLSRLKTESSAFCDFSLSSIYLHLLPLHPLYPVGLSYV